MTDQDLLADALERLRATGTIEYTGEFGAEITTFVPFVCWLKSQGHLTGRRLITYSGMRPYYYFLDEDEYEEKPAARTWLAPEDRIWPTNTSDTATRQSWHVMPDYRTRYAGEGRSFERPILFIQNKFCVEWQRGPINYLPLNALENLFRLSETKFDVVYSRPKRIPQKMGYAQDDNTDCDYPDFELASRFPQVIVLENLCAAEGLPYNLTKLQILAKTYLFVATQGGGAHLLACFGDSIMLVFHRRGKEYPHAYKEGPYKYLSTPPPWLMVARSFTDFVQGTSVIANVEHDNGVPRLSRKFLATVNALRI